MIIRGLFFYIFKKDSDTFICMEYKVGDVIIGTVNQVRPYALFLTFENQQRGLLHISELTDNYVRDIEKFGTVGDQLKVKVLSIDPTNGFLRVSYKAVPDDEKYNSHNDSVHHYAQFDEADFKDLEAKLPEWIEQTLKLAKEDKNND